MAEDWANTRTLPYQTTGEVVRWVLYCSCPNEITSARVVLLPGQKGIQDVHPLAGGLKGWLEQGFPVSSNIVVPSVTKAAKKN